MVVSELLLSSGHSRSDVSLRPGVWGHLKAPDARMVSVSPGEPDPWQLLDPTGQPLLNSAIVEAMRNVSVHDTHQTRALLYQLLLDAVLVAVTPNRPESPRSRIAGKGETLDLVTLRDDEGTVLPLFTSSDAVVRWRPEGAGIMAIPARALFEMAVASGTGKIALDPGSATFGYLTRREIEALSRGRLPLGETEVVADTTEIRIGRPEIPPPMEVLGAIRAVLRTQPLALRAWYFMMQQGTAAPQMSVAIQLRDGADDRVVIRAILDRAGARAEGMKEILFLVADPSWQASLTGGAGTQFYPD